MDMTGSGIKLSDDDDLFGHWLPEHALWMSVIKRSILDALALDKLSKDHQQGAQRWFASQKRTLGSLRWIAETCTTDPDHFVLSVRAYVARMAGDQRRAVVTVVEPL